VKWFCVNKNETIDSVDRLLMAKYCLDFLLSIDHRLYAVQSVVMFLLVFESKFWWIFKMWVRTFSQKTIDLEDIPNEAELRLEKCYQRIFFRNQYFLSNWQKSFSFNFLMGNWKKSN